MAAQKTKSIEEIKNLKQMIALMEALGISSDDFTSVDEMKNRLRAELQNSLKKRSWTAGKVRIS